MPFRIYSVCNRRMVKAVGDQATRMLSFEVNVFSQCWEERRVKRGTVPALRTAQRTAAHGNHWASGLLAGHRRSSLKGGSELIHSGTRCGFDGRSTFAGNRPLS